MLTSEYFAYNGLHINIFALDKKDKIAQATFSNAVPLLKMSKNIREHLCEFMYVPYTL